MVSLLNQSKLLILLHGQKENNELMSASSPDAQSLFSMTENNSNGNAGKKQKNSAILVYHMLAVHHSFRIIQEIEMGAALIDWFKMQFLAKMLTKRFGSDLAKLKQET